MDFCFLNSFYKLVVFPLVFVIQAFWLDKWWLCVCSSLYISMHEGAESFHCIKIRCELLYVPISNCLVGQLISWLVTQKMNMLLVQVLHALQVVLGRATMDVDVDIDLGREGRANKISRRQVWYFDFLDMVTCIFFVTCGQCIEEDGGDLNLESAYPCPIWGRYLTTLPKALSSLNLDVELLVVDTSPLINYPWIY